MELLQYSSDCGINQHKFEEQMSPPPGFESAYDRDVRALEKMNLGAVAKTIDLSVFSEDDDCDLSDEETYDSSDEETEDPEEVERYKKQLKESEGFDVDAYSRIGYYRTVTPLNDVWMKYCDKKLRYCMGLAIGLYEERRGEGLTDAKLVKATSETKCCDHIFYITFTAKGSSDGQVRTYQAKVFSYSCREKLSATVEMVRPKDDVSLTVVNE